MKAASVRAGLVEDSDKARGQEVEPAGGGSVNPPGCSTLTTSLLGATSTNQTKVLHAFSCRVVLSSGPRDIQGFYVCTKHVSRGLPVRDKREIQFFNDARRRCVSHVFGTRWVRVACVLTVIRLDHSIKGSRGYHERFVGTCRFLNEVSPARCSQQCVHGATSQHQMEAACDGDKATAAGMQCPPELQSLVASSAV